MTKKPYELYCGFCCKSQHNVRKLIVGRNAMICDECIELCLDILDEPDLPTAPTSPPMARHQTRKHT